jgi:hypothetical protein
MDVSCAVGAVNGVQKEKRSSAERGAWLWAGLKAVTVFAGWHASGAVMMAHCWRHTVWQSWEAESGLGSWSAVLGQRGIS